MQQSSLCRVWMSETGSLEYELRGEVSFPDLVRILKHSSDCFASSYSIRRYMYLPITLLTTSIPTIVHTDNSLTDISYCTSYWAFFTLAANTSTCKLYSATSRLLPTPLHPSTPHLSPSRTRFAEKLSLFTAHLQQVDTPSFCLGPCPDDFA